MRSRAQRAHELSELKLLKAETVKQQHAKVVAAAAEAAATPAKLSKPSTKTPPSLPEDATPAEKYFASKLKDVASMQATHTGKLDGIQYSVITALSPATRTRSRGMHGSALLV